MRWSKRGQNSLEFIVLAGFMLFVFTAFIFAVKERSAAAAQQQRYNDISSVAQTLNQEVATAFRVQDGYSRMFDIPSTINGEEYAIIVDSNTELTLRTANEEYVLFLPTNVTVVDGGGAQAVTLFPGKVTISKEGGNITLKGAILEPDTCNFEGAQGLPVSCYASTGGGCTTPPGGSSCLAGVFGTQGQSITWTSSCTPATLQTAYTGAPKDINFTCVSATETFTCRFTGTSLVQSCWTSSASCIGNPSCQIAVNSLWGQNLIIGSSCGSTTVRLDADPANNDITLDCSLPVTETVTCLFLENPIPGAQHTCFARNNPLVNCSSTAGQCTMAPQLLPGTGMDWDSDCRGGASTYVTGEQKTLPFFCNIS